MPLDLAQHMKTKAAQELTREQKLELALISLYNWVAQKRYTPFTRFAQAAGYGPSDQDIEVVEGLTAIVKDALGVEDADENDPN